LPFWLKLFQALFIFDQLLPIVRAPKPALSPTLQSPWPANAALLKKILSTLTFQEMSKTPVSYQITRSESDKNMFTTMAPAMRAK